MLDALKEIKNDDPDVSFLPQVIFTSVSHVICITSFMTTACHHHFDHHPRCFYHHHREQFYKDTLDKAETLLAEGCHPCLLL